ncbi:hypothetical protein GH714_009939 [Hevea brasiliensis]|uniref:Oleosin n=1 Tax=Hevea brasiliensis TaxID=3981 RepID=A0A6A6M891_HEVBR|nr:hypothetical protein GH714_009939 [Hevea brasiliensis]
MTDRSQPHQVQVHPQLRYDPGYKGQQKGPSASKVLAVVTLLPVGGGLLALAGLTLVVVAVSSFWGIWADGADIAVVGVAVPPSGHAGHAGAARPGKEAHAGYGWLWRTED